MNIKWKKIIGIMLCVSITIIMVSGCGESKDPTVVSFWHVYGGQTESPMNDMVNKFNQTVGNRKNIRVKVTSIGDNNSVHKNILASAYEDPGANEMPDMFIAYPKTVRAMPDKNILVNYDNVLSKEEKDKFVQSFMDEGVVDGKQLVLPVAKSTEILYINKTGFDKFAEDTGVTLKDLETWEGFFKICQKYKKWTDDKTPNVKNDGKSFFVHDDHIDFFQTGVASLGGEFFNEKGKINYSKDFYRVWDEYSTAAVNGYMWLGNGYGTEPFRTGDAIGCVASSASVMYFADKVTYQDNSEEPLEIVSLPLPVFEGGEKVAVQRGAGICTVKSTPEKEKACQEFINWLIEKDNNVDLVTRLGYIPVTKDAYDLLPTALENLENPRYKSLYEAVMKTNEDYKFYTAPQFEGYLEFESNFEESIRSIMREGETVVRQGQSQVSAKVQCLNRFKNIR